jgi:DNA-binding PadR family transcriptional regulator
MNLDERTRLSPKEAEILQLLISNGELYGLEMIKRSPVLKRGTIYVLLNRMYEKGFVSSKVSDEKSGGPSRRKYKVTALGRRALLATETASSILAGRYAWGGQ